MQSKTSLELPHDLLAEKSLVGCLIIDGASFDEIVDLGITKTDFYHPKYGIMFDAISELSNKNQAVDYVTVCSKLSDIGKIEAVGGHSFVHEIVEDQASSANI